MLLSPCRPSTILSDNLLVAIVAGHPFGRWGCLCLLLSLEGTYVLLCVLGSLGPIATNTVHIRTTTVPELPSLEFEARGGHPWVWELLNLHRCEMNIGFGGSRCLPDRPVHRNTLLHHVFEA